LQFESDQAIMFEVIWKYTGCG